MKDQTTSEDGLNNTADLMSARFAHMVMQQSSMAMMLMGKSPHPETGQTVRDLDAAQFFIDQLEMLEQKTKGNLNAEEMTLLKQSLMSLRLAYVEAVDSPAQAAPAAPGAAAAAAAPTAPAQPEDSESHKKFTKKY